MKEELRYNWLDVFRAPRIALSLQKIWIMFLPLLFGYLIYLALTFLGLRISGEAVLETAWSTFGLIPCTAGVSGVTVWGQILWGVGVVALVIAALFGGTAVARATYLELKGETFFTYRELYGFARRYAKNAVGGPAGILAVIVSIVVCGLLLGLIGRIPFAGEVPVVGLSIIWLGISFFLVALLLVFLFCVLLAPAITATTRGDFFEVITETFSVTFSEPYRLVWYQVVLVTVGGFAVSILGMFVKLAYRAMTFILVKGMGSDFTEISSKTAQIAQEWFPGVAKVSVSMDTLWTPHLIADTIIPKIISWVPGVSTAWNLAFAPIANPAAAAGATGYETVWAYVLLFVAALVGFLVIACYGAALLAAGNTLIYIALHKIKDEEDLLELEEEEDEESDDAAEEAPPEEKDESEKEEAPPEEKDESQEEKAEEEKKDGDA